MPNDETVVDQSISPSSDASKGQGPRYNEDEVLFEGEGEATGDEDEDENEEELEADESEDEDEESSKEDEEESDQATDEDEVKPDIPFDRPTIKELKGEYPDLFKKFPSLRDAYFREIEFTKLFPTVDDAKEAFEENTAYTTLSETALSGDPVPLIDSIEKADKKALEVFSSSFLPALYKKDEGLYAEVITPVFQNLVRNLFASKDENERNAALVLSDFIFGSENGEAIAKGTKTAVKLQQLTDEQKKLKADKDAAMTTAFRQSAGRVQKSVENSLTALILKNPNFDPNKAFSPFLRKQGAAEVVNRIKASLVNDKGHLAVMAARWKRARANGFTSDEESKIVSTYLARAKSLLPDACSKVSAAMLGTKVKAASAKRNNVKEFRKENTSGRTPRSGGVAVGDKIDYSKVSDMELFSS